MSSRAEQNNSFIGYDRQVESKSLRQLIWGVIFLLIGLVCLFATGAGACRFVCRDPDVKVTDAYVMSVQHVTSSSAGGKAVRMPVYRIVYDGHVKENIFVSGPVLHAGESTPIAYLKSNPQQISKPEASVSPAEMLGNQRLWGWILVAIIAPNLIVLGGAIIYEEMILND